MKVKYSGTPFHHFKCGIIMPGIIELDDEWARRLIEAGIIESVDNVRTGLEPAPTDEVPEDVRAVREPPPQDETPSDVGADPSVRPGQTHGSAPTGLGIVPPDYHEAEDIGDPVTTEPRKRKRGK